jgi:hypothetical protein
MPFFTRFLPNFRIWIQTSLNRKSERPNSGPKKTSAKYCQTVLYENESDSRPVGDTPNAEKVWKLYARYGNVATVAEKIHMSQKRVIELIDARSQALLDSQSAEQKARALTMLLDRWGELYEMAAEDKQTCEPGSNGALGCMAVMAKCNQEVGKLFQLGQQFEKSAVSEHVRLAEVMERLASIGVHSKAALIQARQVSRSAGFSLEEGQEVSEVSSTSVEKPVEGRVVDNGGPVSV